MIGRGEKSNPEALARAIRTAQKWEGDRRKSELIDDLAEMVSRQYDRASAYTNLIGAAGYAAFFAVWGTLGPDKHPRVFVVAGFAMFVSVAVFIAWEVFKAAHASILFYRIVPLLKAEPMQVRENVDRVNAVMRGHDLWTARIWLPILVMSILPALVGAGFLAQLFLLRLLDPAGPMK